MYVTKSAVVGGATLAILALALAMRASAAPSSAGSPFDTSVEPPSYTFEVDVAMAMRHFPWLHFHMQGDGAYEPGQSYLVHFTSLPWFVPRQQHDADLSMLDPLMWPKRFTYERVGEHDGQTLFALHSINDASLKDATVTLGPLGHARRVDANYSDGTHIDMTVNSSEVGGFLLPATLKADIDEPHLALSANADFKNYAFTSGQAPIGPSR
jgi:hypothetical protein